MTELETHDKRTLAIIKLVTEQAEELRETRLQAISDVGQLQSALEENAYLREQLKNAERAVLQLGREILFMVAGAGR